MKTKESKGTFGPVRLPVSKSYLKLRTQNRFIFVGIIGALLISALIVFNFFFQNATTLSNGPLSSNHANFESDCTACHTHPLDNFGKGPILTQNDDPTPPFFHRLFNIASVRDENCSVCHEKVGNPVGVHAFASHYLYRSKDLTRLKASEYESPCVSCHPEHLGRRATITNVPDARCLACHPFGSFNQQHPEFEFAAQRLPDEANLKYTHIYHVKQVMARNALVDIEKACLYCHNPSSDGKNFEALNFNRHCGSCHLTAAEKTPAMKVWDPGEPNSPGVLTLEDFRSLGELGNEWAFRTSAGEFSRIEDRITKSRIDHEDAWILANLKELRQLMGPETGLSGLLRASVDVPDPHDDKILYEEAIETLRSFITELRTHPEAVVVDELTEMNRLLDQVEGRLKDPYTLLDGTQFSEGSRQMETGLNDEQIEEVENLVALLTQPCQTCHRVQNGFIARVQRDQRTLIRAEFDHRAHILQKRCLDCHNRIPFLDDLPREVQLTTEELNAELTSKGLETSWLAQALELSEETVSNIVSGTVKPSTQLQEQIIYALESWARETPEDNSSIQNLPTIEECQTCHQVAVTSNRCVTCHLFHPNKLNRANLLLYVDPQTGRLQQ